MKLDDLIDLLWHTSQHQFGFQVSSHSVFVVRIRNGLFVYLMKTSMNFAHFSRIIIRGPNSLFGKRSSSL